MQMHKLKLVGIAGKARSGKDTAGLHLVESHNYIKRNFADSLKDVCSIMFATPREYFDSADMKEVVLPAWGVTPRAMAQFVGTELVRHNIHKLIPGFSASNTAPFWAKVLIEELIQQFKLNTQSRTFPLRVVICDVRFQDEADWLVNTMGGTLIKLHRDNLQEISGIPGHASEAGVDISRYPPNQVFEIANNSTKAALKEQLNAVMFSADQLQLL